MIAAVVLPFAAMPYAASEVMDDKLPVTQYNDTGTGNATREIGTQEFDPAKQYGKIPDGVMLDRNDPEWVAQKLSDPEFEEKQAAIRAYVAYDGAEKNGWNEAMKRTAVVAQNFDVMTGEAGNGFELVALAKALDKLQGAYSATEPEKRFHDWVAARYAVPDTARDIDARIDALKDELGPALVSQAVAAFDEQARHGNIPYELASTDGAFWAITALIASCDHDPDCDSTFARKVRDNKLYERDVPDGIPTTIPTATMMDYFLPAAYAVWPDAEHRTMAHMEPWDCNYDNCRISADVTTTGTYNISLHVPGTRHATEPGAQLSVVSCGTGDSRSSTYNVVHAEFNVGIVTHCTGFDARYGCAFDFKEVSLPFSSTSVWRGSLTGTTNAYIQR